MASLALPRVFLILSAAVLSGCAAPGPGAWQQGPGYRWRALAPAGTGGAGFTALDPARLGIDFRNDVSDSATRRNRHLMHGSGVALGDVDGDGRSDIYLARIAGPNALYRNLGGWRFRDVAGPAGVELADRPSTGAVLADVDGDGDLDLLVNAMGAPNTLFLNDGAGRFTDATAGSGWVGEPRGSTTSTLADVDGDGDLDLYVANYKARTMLDSLPPAEREFNRLTRRVGEGYEVRPALREHYRVVPHADPRLVGVVQRADPDWFYLNDGTGRFARVALAGDPRFLDRDGHPLEREPDDFGLAARFGDLTGDGAPELWVANDFEDPDQVWINDGRGGFRLAGPRAIRQTSNSAMAVDFADIDRDGDVDVYEVDMLARDSRHRKTQAPALTLLPKAPTDVPARDRWQRNVLLQNRGDGTFAEIAALAGVEASGWSWSTLFLDVDLDGFEDILIGTGHPWDLMDADTQERLRRMPASVDWRDERKLYPGLTLPNVAFRNRGDLTFEDATTAWRFGLEADISHGMAAGDLDGDGDLDLVINRLNAPPLMLRNDAPAPRLLVRLAGRAPNTGGIGALVWVRGGAVPGQSKEVTAGGLYLSSSEPRVMFAAGPADSLTLEVEWRSGALTVLAGLAPGREYEIAEPGPGEPAPPSRVSAGGAPLFEGVADLEPGPVDRPYNDYARQPLLPWKLSREGPGVGWIDLDGDGDDDLVAGSGGGGRPVVWLNEPGGFRSGRVTMPVDSLDLTGIAGYRAGGRTRVLFGRSSYEARSPRQALAEPGVVAVEAGRTLGRWSPVAGPDTASVGPIALADVDGDGDLDLFVGGRVAPGVYPVPVSSRLFLNRNGRFTRDDSARAALHGLGLVSGAVFTDLDADGDPDLALAVEWGPVRILVNDRGRFSERTRELGLASLTGRWNGITAGDFDGDGRMDLAVTNWGRNTAYQADSAAPLLLYYGAYGGDGVVQPILARADPRLGGIAPLEPFAGLATAIPAIRSRVSTFAAYANATMETLLGGRLRQGGRVEARTLDHVVLLNRGARFEVRPLPIEAQIAPAFGVAAADLDGDGTEDLALAQNFSWTDLTTPRFNAGLGLVLLGDGAGGFRPLGSRAAGLDLIEDQRGLAVTDYDGDGRVDLAVGRNGAPVALFHNVGARPGLVVRFAGEAAGTVLRLETADGLGPARELHAGSGYRSQDGRTVVMSGSARPTALRVRWPGRAETRIALDPGQRTVELSPP